jgi:hypothetical protein
MSGTQNQAYIQNKSCKCWCLYEEKASFVIPWIGYYFVYQAPYRDTRPMSHEFTTQVY